MPVPTDIVIPNELLVGIKPKGFVTIIIGPQEKDSNARVVTLEPQFRATVIGKTIDGRYPDYRRVIPREVSGSAV